MQKNSDFFLVEVQIGEDFLKDNLEYLSKYIQSSPRYGHMYAQRCVHKYV